MLKSSEYKAQYLKSSRNEYKVYFLCKLKYRQATTKEQDFKISFQNTSIILRFLMHLAKSAWMYIVTYRLQKWKQIIL